MRWDRDGRKDLIQVWSFLLEDLGALETVHEQVVAALVGRRRREEMEELEAARVGKVGRVGVRAELLVGISEVSMLEISSKVPEAAVVRFSDESDPPDESFCRFWGWIDTGDEREAVLVLVRMMSAAFR